MFLAPRAPAWTPEHAADWHAFIHSPVGLDLMERFRAVAAEVSAQACADAFHTAHSAGTAHGWQEACTWLESLSRSSRVTEEPPPEVNPAHDNQASRRDELVELFAP